MFQRREIKKLKEFFIQIKLNEINLLSLINEINLLSK